MQGSLPEASLRRSVALVVALGLIVGAYFVARQANVRVLGVRAENPHEACFRAKINNERVTRGMRRLADHPRVHEIAVDHANQMAAEQTIYHNEQLSNELPPYEYAGENVGMGPDCDTLHEAFMASTSHRSNVLDPDYTHLGMGVRVRDGTLYVDQVFFTPAERSTPGPQPSPEPSCR
jgi:uncharacterized protein YkwD